jgi:Kef-type K+ transport system membrane component KefB
MTPLLLNSVDELLHLPVKDPVMTFGLILLIILLVPIVLRFFRTPAIVGLIISGVVVGPNGLNILERGDAVTLLGTMGLLYIMFIAGLELDLNSFRQNKQKSILFGIFTFLVPLSLGLLVCTQVLGLSLSASLLVSSMFSTHTLIAYPIVTRLGLVKEEVVGIAVGGTIITDTAVLLLLTVIIAFTQGQLDSVFFMRMFFSLLIFGGIVLFALPMIAKWFLKSTEGDKILQFVFVLAAMFFSAVLAMFAGVEPIIGAFLSGLALNRYVPNGSALMNRIEFTGNALFIPIFLISVGMLVDLSVLLQGPEALLFAITLTVTALVGKWLAAWATQLIYGYSYLQRGVLFGLSTAHAAATLAVIMVGFNIGLVDDNVLNGTIILILVTCLVASITTEVNGRKLVRQRKENEQIESDPGHLMVCIANPSTLKPLVDLGIRLASKGDTQAVSAVAIVENNESARERIQQTKKMLDEAELQAQQEGVSLNVLARVDLNISTGIANTSKEISADTVMLGWGDRTSTTEWIFGNIMSQTLRQTNETLIFYRVAASLDPYKNLVIFMPSQAHLDPGFSIWVNRLARLSKAMSSSVSLYGSADSLNHPDIERFSQLGGKVNKIEFDHHGKKMSDIPSMLAPQDLAIFVSARVGTIAHEPFMNVLPDWLSQNLTSRSFLLIYPETLEQPESMWDYN